MSHVEKYTVCSWNKEVRH